MCFQIPIPRCASLESPYLTQYTVDGVRNAFHIPVISPCQLRRRTRFEVCRGLPPTNRSMRLLLPTHLVLFLQTCLAFFEGAAAASIAGGSNAGSAVGHLGSIKTTPVTVYKPRSLDFLQKTRLRSLQHAECLAPANETERLQWDAVEVQGPNVEDRHTLAQLARMAGNAYALRGLPNWYDIDEAWNKVCHIPLICVPFLSICVELSFRLGRRRRFQRARISRCRQQHCSSVDQGDDNPRPDLEVRQVQ